MKVHISKKDLAAAVKRRNALFEKACDPKAVLPESRKLLEYPTVEEMQKWDLENDFPAYLARLLIFWNLKFEDVENAYYAQGYISRDDPDAADQFEYDFRHSQKMISEIMTQYVIKDA